MPTLVKSTNNFTVMPYSMVGPSRNVLLLRRLLYKLWFCVQSRYRACVHRVSANLVDGNCVKGQWINVGIGMCLLRFMQQIDSD